MLAESLWVPWLQYIPYGFPQSMENDSDDDDGE
jgi:hypothetical protein